MSDVTWDDCLSRHVNKLRMGPFVALAPPDSRQACPVSGEAWFGVGGPCERWLGQSALQGMEV